MQNKNKLIILIFLLILGGIAVASIYGKKLSAKKEVEPVNNMVGTNKPIKVPETTATDIEKQSMLDIIVSHNNESDCWVVINSKVYNITSLFGVHPGGNDPLKNSCGKDATELFTTRGKEPANPHPSTAKMKLEELLVK
ncbi:hypothetical protein A2V49_00200 [candidate division WWE3 bacterium RBG_19FT_COMBO_34_6]|uniref:Cytochrome b5 heme-binding domain-containing protein n=1 Tax=candidate division WWE3 bacterium RBG_19FT_COMBO_34_6 TaxID=1802612 RepID=A0A1F4ULI8_UNCKA|nr:MAG: hypothetical protein A2V49_00200 [candidate division WWE3 bacterium RBG_19FT_COMBO_34_6]